jgi:hypothetical protein
MWRALLFAPCLTAVFATISGCVVPVAPTWSDPDRNYPPSIASADPPVGTILGRGIDGGPPTTVEVKVELADQNVGDNLYLRWIIDYPPASADTSVLETIKPGGDAIVRTADIFAPDCRADHLSRTVSEHRLLLAVSDRPFASDDPGSTTTPDQVNGGYLVEAVWPFLMSCQ